MGFIFSAILSEKSLPKRGVKIAVGIHILVGIYNLSGFMHPFQPRILTGNVYFHVNTACLEKKQADFLASLVQIPQEIRPFLTPAHTTYLRNNGFMT